MQKKEKINQFLKENTNLIVILLFFATFFMINLFDMKYKFNEVMTSGRMYYIIFCFIALIISIIVIFMNKKMKNLQEDKIPKIFVITALTLGIGFIILSPLFTGSDEHNHFYRIYEITSGTLVTPTDEYVGSKLPSSLKDTFQSASGSNTSIKYENIDKMFSIKLNKNEKVQYGNDFTDQYNNTALYSPIQYLPQVIGFSIGNILNLNPYMIGILGRISNLIFYVVLGYFALKYIPKSKLFYLIILISPNMLQCAATLSADAFTNVIFLLLIAVIFNKVYFKNPLNKKDKTILFILSVFISLCKIVYVPIVLLLFLLNKEQFKGGKKAKLLYVGFTILISALVSLIWMSYTDGVFAIAYDKTDIQKEFILSNIIEYAIIFIRTFADNFIKYIECLFVGTTMYHSQLKMPAFISSIYILIVILTLFKDKTKKEIKTGEKVFVSLISIVIIGLISTAIYIQCTAQFNAIANPTITGIQGRYFIPIALLIPYAIPIIKKKIKLENKILFSWAVAINVITYFYMFSQFAI